VALHDSPIGLGYRVPMVIASPWSKGGWVNSEVFDHTSTLQFLEHFIQKKHNKSVVESNLTEWRRLVCGNLTSAFRPLPDVQRPGIDFVNRNKYVERIYSARDKSAPGNFEAKSIGSLASIQNNLSANTSLNLQEKGTKPACAIPYDLDVNMRVESGKLRFDFLIKGELPQTKEVGVPFQLISHTAFGNSNEIGKTWNFAANSSEPLHYEIDLSDIKNETFCFSVHGPNGFYRAFKGNVKSSFPSVLSKTFSKKDVFQITSKSKVELQISDASYGRKGKTIKANKNSEQSWSLEDSHGWYDFEVTSKQDPSLYLRFAGHAENGKPSITDPLMGGIV
jgi:phospholipase C